MNRFRDVEFWDANMLRDRTRDYHCGSLFGCHSRAHRFDECGTSEQFRIAFQLDLAPPGRLAAVAAARPSVSEAFGPGRKPARKLDAARKTARTFFFFSFLFFKPLSSSGIRVKFGLRASRALTCTGNCTVLNFVL